MLIRKLSRGLFLLIIVLSIHVTVTGRELHLAGIVLDAGNLQPVAGANIYNAQMKLIGHTDENGYYNIIINCNDEGEIQFSLSISKRGYKLLKDKEHWGNLANGTKSIIYYGMSSQQSGAEPFSKLSNSSIKGDDLSYQNVLSGLPGLRKQKTFDDQLAKAKEGNENVLVPVNGKLYIVDKTGWIQISSGQDIISLNGKKDIMASELNAVIQRKDIKSMTPLESGEAKFAIYTK